jgi:hypothetical protein
VTDDPVLLPPFLLAGIWLSYGLLGFYFMRSRDLPWKRRLWRPYTIGGGVLFVLIAAGLGFPWPMLIVVAVMSAGITAINLRRAPQFCDQCGATAWSMMPFTKPRHCSYCGAPLNPPAA